MFSHSKRAWMSPLYMLPITSSHEMLFASVHAMFEIHTIKIKEISRVVSMK